MMQKRNVGVGEALEQAQKSAVKNGIAFPSTFSRSQVGTPVNPVPQLNPLKEPRIFPSISELLHAFKRRWILALFLGLVGAMVVGAVVWIAMPSGKHHAVAFVQMRTDQPGLIGRGEMNQEQYEDFKQRQKAKLETLSFLKQVVAHENVRDLNLVTIPEKPEVVLKDMLTIKWRTNELMAISLDGDNTDELKKILDTLVAVYVQVSQEEERSIRNSEEAALINKKNELDGKIKVKKEYIERLRSQGVDGNPATRIFFMNLVKEKITRYEQEIFNDNERKRKYSGELSSIKARLDSKALPLDPAFLNTQLRQEPEYVNVMTLLAQVEQEHKQRMAKVPVGSPFYKKFEDEIQKERTKYQKQLDDIRDRLIPQYRENYRATLEIEKSQYEKLLAETNASLEEHQQLKQKEEELLNRMQQEGGNVSDEEAEVKQLQEQSLLLNKQITQIELNKDAGSRISPFEEAEVFPNYNFKQKIFLSIGMAVATFLGTIGFISFLEWRNRRVDSVEQVVSELGVRVLGTVPAFPSRQALESGQAAKNQNWRFILNEAVNSTRTMILHTARTQQMQVMMITSPMQGEAKTSLSSQLATSMATAGLRTLLLDCDMRNPSLQKLFDVDLTPGCAEVLLQEADIGDVVQATTIPNLWLIPAGICNHRVLSALAQGQSLDMLIQRLRTQFDYIIVDSCPVLPVADTLLVAQYVDAVIISILQDVSQLPKVEQTLERLTSLGVKVIGSVVSGIKADNQAYGYNYVKQLPA